MDINTTVKLNNGVEIPQLGFGTWQIEASHTKDAVKWAIEAGYRHIDTAQAYGNEEGVGDGILASGIEREKLFVTTKLDTPHLYNDTELESFEESLKKLKLDYVDLFMLHWPIKGKFVKSWKVLEKLHEEGKIRALGVSNFHRQHLEILLSECKYLPVVDQVECHPYLTNVELKNYCKERGIQVEAWSPLGSGMVLQDPVIAEIGKKYNKTTAQVILRWHLQQGDITIPKSAHKERIFENRDIYDFVLTKEDVDAINGLNRGKRAYEVLNPDTFNW